MTWFTSFLRRPPIGWWDLIDILVVTILIYEVLKLIRGTRAVQMALGGCVLVGLFYGSRWGHLETVNWLVRNMIGYVVFAGIVLFQSDIRRARALRPGAVLPPTRESGIGGWSIRNWSSPRACCRRSGSARSSRSSGRSAAQLHRGRIASMRC
jgi:hypothetical protein